MGVPVYDVGLPVSFALLSLPLYLVEELPRILNEIRMGDDSMLGTALIID